MRFPTTSGIRVSSRVCLFDERRVGWATWDLAEDGLAADLTGDDWVDLDDADLAS